MWPKPFMKLYLSSVYETLISQDWNFAIIASNLSFIVHIQIQLVYLINTVGGLILLDMYYIITIGPRLSWSCIWFLHLHLSFISFKYKISNKKLWLNCVHVGRCNIGNKLSKTKWINRVWGFKVHILSILTADWFVFWSIILAAHPSVKTLMFRFVKELLMQRRSCTSFPRKAWRGWSPQHPRGRTTRSSSP